MAGHERDPLVNGTKLRFISGVTLSSHLSGSNLKGSG